MVLNILNGDCACAEFRKSGLSGSVLVWRENYLQGQLPALYSSLEEFVHIRATELQKISPGVDGKQILVSLRKMDSALLELTRTDEVNLWFDFCMFDQIILARILYLLGTMHSMPKVFLSCSDPVVFAEKKRIAPTGIFWAAFVNGKAAIEECLLEADFTDFPYMKEALIRYCEEFPDKSTFGRSQRQLLEIIGKGITSPRRIFEESATYEAHPFMGDTMCYQMLDQLARQGVVAIKGATRLLLADEEMLEKAKVTLKG